MALKPRPFEDPELEKRFQEHFYSDGLAQMVFAISLMGVGVVMIYLQYGLSDFEGTGWFEANQLQRFYRILVIAGFLTVTLIFWKFWRKHWAYLAGVFVLVVYTVGILVLKIKMGATGLPMTEAGGWRSVVTQISLILLTFPFIRISLTFLLVVASSSTIALLYFAFEDPVQLTLAGTGLLSAMISGAAIWFNNYRRERDIFDNAIALESAVLAAKESEARATELANRQRQLVRAVTHDIRQPMAAVSIQMSLLQETARQQPKTGDLAPLAFALDALQTQVEEIANDALADKPSLSYEVGPVDVTNVVAMVVQLHEPLARQHDVELRQWVTPKHQPVIATTDVGQLTTMLQSLLSNAIKFRDDSPKKAKRIIFVGLQVIQNRAIVKVFDNGLGISPENLPHIFSEGFSTSTNGQGNSNGLGLFNVRRLSAALPGHDVKVSSQHGRFTRFDVSVPLAHFQLDQTVNTGIFTRTLALEHRQQLSMLVNRQVLIVEDDPLVRQSLIDLFQSWQAVVEAAPNATSAIARIRDFDRAFEVIICDFDLGEEQTGLDVIHYAKQYYNSPIATLLVSGSAKVPVNELNGVTYQPKPLEPNKLIQTLHEQLARRDQLANREA